MSIKWELFPYKQPRPFQKEAIERIFQGLDNMGKGGITLMHAPTGSGKSINSLLPAIQTAIIRGKKVVILVNRVTQSDRFLEELELIKKKMGPSAKVQASVLQSKQDFCVFKSAKQYRDRKGVWRDLPYPVFIANCAIAKATRKCPYYGNSYKKMKPSEDLKMLIDKRANKIYSPTEAVRDGLQWELCPYEVMKKHSSTSNVIIGTYGYVFNPDLQTSFLQITNSTLDELILIVDEAHNLPDFIREAMKFELSNTDLAKALAEYSQFSSQAFEQNSSNVDKILCPACGSKIELLQAQLDERIGVSYCRSCKRSPGMDLLEKIQQMFTIYGSAKDGEVVPNPLSPFPEEMRKKAKREMQILGGFAAKALGAEDIKNPASSQGSERPELRELEGDSATLRILHFIDYLEKIATNTSQMGSQIREEYVVSFSVFNDKRKFVIECFDPSLVSRTLFSKVYGAILMSATLTPLNYYADILGLKDRVKETLELPQAFPRRNRLLCYVKEADIAGKQDLSRPTRKHEIIKQIIRAALESPARTVGIYTRSYQLAQLAKQIRTKRDVFFTNAKTVPEQVKEHLEHSSKAAFVAVQGGRYSEGVEFTDELGSMLDLILIIGIQFPPPTPVQKAYTQFCTKRFGGKGWDYANRVPAIAKLVQALGRAQRSENDRAALIIADRRISQNQNIRYFPKEYVEELQAVDLRSLPRVLARFYARTLH